MIVQSLNLCVPGGCPNDCKFCVARMHANDYSNLVENDGTNRDIHERDYKDRLQFARDNGCNTVVLTGTGEPLSNTRFLDRFNKWNREIPSPFKWIDLQTSGVYLNEGLLMHLRDNTSISTISLSVSDMFSDERNAEICGTPERLKFSLKERCSQIRNRGFNLRLALNMSSVYNGVDPAILFGRAAELGANQVTFKRLDSSGNPDGSQAQWINSHPYEDFTEIRDYIGMNGRSLEIMPYGATRYSVHGMSTVTDHDCMSRQAKEVIKYLVLRPDCRLYTKWDDRGSLLF
jgi:hypothetical protein